MDLKWEEVPADTNPDQSNLSWEEVPAQQYTSNEKYSGVLDFLQKRAEQTRSDFFGGDLTAISPFKLFTGANYSDLYQGQAPAQQEISAVQDRYKDNPDMLQAISSVNTDSYLSPNVLKFLGPSIGDELQGGVVAFQNMFSPGSFLDKYQAAKEISRQRNEMANPYEQGAAGISGSMLTDIPLAMAMPMKKLYESGKYFKAGAYPSAAIGLLHGFGEGEGLDRFTSGAKQSLISGLLGGTVSSAVSRAGEFLAQKLYKISDINKHLGALARESRVSEKDALSAYDKLNQFSGGQARPADIHPGFTASAAEGVRLSPYQSGEAAKNLDRSGIGDYVLKSFDKASGTTAGTVDDVISSISKAKADVRPLYKSSYEKFVILDKEGVSLIKQLGRDKKVFDEAIDDFARSEEITNIKFPSIKDIKEGKRIPFAVFDAIKRFAQERAGKGDSSYYGFSSRLTEYAKKIGGPDYVAALEKSGDYITNRNAFKLGEKLLTEKDSVIKGAMEKMSDVDMAYFRSGARSAFENFIKGPKGQTGQTIERDLIGKNTLVNKLSKVLNSSDDAAKMADDILMAGQMGRTDAAVSGKLSQGFAEKEASRLGSIGEPSAIRELAAMEPKTSLRKLVGSHKFNDQKVEEFASQWAQKLLSTGGNGRKVITDMYRAADKLDPSKRANAYKAISMVSIAIERELKNNNGK